MNLKKKILIAIPIILALLIGTFLIWYNYHQGVEPKAPYPQETMEQRGKLVSYEKVNTVLAEDIIALYPEADEQEGDLSSLVKYDVDLYSVVYTSVFQDELLELSGLIAVPQKEGELSHLQYHHGTLLPYPYPNGEGCLDAPSLYDGTLGENGAQYESRIFSNFLPSYGYLVSSPDYVGYNISEKYEHPYSVNPILAEQSVDMILATREFAEEMGITLNENLFLSGWSEGGAAAVATQKLVESDYSEQIQITANAPLAGFYNIAEYAKMFLTVFPFNNTDWGEDLDVLIWVVYSIDKYLGEAPIENLWDFEVGNQLDVLQNRPTSTPSEVIDLMITKRGQLLQKFYEINLVDNWTAEAPIYVHHGTEDDIVYYDNNADTFVKEQAKNGGNVELITYDGHDHYTLIQLYVMNMIEEFEEYK